MIWQKKSKLNVLYYNQLQFSVRRKWDHNWKPKFLAKKKNSSNDRVQWGYRVGIILGRVFVWYWLRVRPGKQSKRFDNFFCHFFSASIRKATPVSAFLHSVSNSKKIRKKPVKPQAPSPALFACVSVNVHSLVVKMTKIKQAQEYPKLTLPFDEVFFAKNFVEN